MDSRIFIRTQPPTKSIGYLRHFQADSPENGLNLLKKTHEYPHLRSLRVSLFLDDLELEVTDTAFEWGMVSWHPLQFSQDKLKKVFSDMFEVVSKGSRFGPTKWATQQLVAYLEGQKRFEEIALFRERLLKQFPDDSDNTLGLVRAYFQSGNTKNGLELLGEALALELPEALKVVQEFKIDQTKIKLDLRLPSCLIIGGQDAHVQGMRHLLTKLGVSEILLAPSAEQSFEMMKKREGKTFVLLHSDLPDMEGGICLQRLRELGFHESPICILATSGQKRDETLFSEMNVLKTLEVKDPFDPKQFASDLVKALQQERFEHSPEVLVRRIRQAIRQNMFDKAALLQEHLIFSGQLTPGLDSYLKAEFAYGKKDYIEAKEKCLAALKTESPKQFVLDLLGRTLMHLGSYADAQKCLKAAHASSGKCLSRLCAIAETDSAQGNDEAALATLATASDLAPGSTIVHKAQAALAVRSGDILYAVELMKKSNDPLEIVSMINNSGVALVRMGQVERGKKCYANALKILENCDVKYSKVQVMYNIALAYARENELQRSADILEKIAKSEGGANFAKARSLQSKILTALKTGEAFVLGGGSPQSASAPADIPLAFLEERFGARPETKAPVSGEGGAQVAAQAEVLSPEIESVLNTASSQNSKSVLQTAPTRIVGCMGFFFPTKQISPLGVKLFKKSV